MLTLHINLDKVEQNTRLVAGMLRPHGLRLVGVTKACQGNERVAGAMLAGGATALADARPECTDNLRSFFPDTRLELLRPVIGAGKLSAAADIFFVSSEVQARMMMKLCPARPIRFCLMVETGDGREGAPLPVAALEAGRVARLQGAELSGLATVAACARPGASLTDAIEAFFRAVAGAADLFAKAVRDPARDPFFSVGGSGLLALLIDAETGKEASGGAISAPLEPATELRAGEAILLGRIPSGGGGRFLPGAHQDAFVIEAPLLEAFKEEGGVRALVGVGVQDVGLGQLIPAQDGIKPVRITSDYLIVQYPPEALPPQIGSPVSFIPTYFSLLAGMNSPTVRKQFQ